MDLNSWLEHISKLHSLNIDYRLEPVIEFYQKLNLPKLAKTIITVAGTNGKGTTVGLLEKIYKDSGYKVGTYTSPHLIKFNERIKINAQNLSLIHI